MSAFEALTNGQVKFTDDDGNFHYFAHGDYIVVPSDTDRVEILSRQLRHRELQLYVSGVTLPAGVWTAETLADTLNAEPFFFETDAILPDNAATESTLATLVKETTFASAFNPFLFDAVDRFRVSQIFTLGDYKILNSYFDTLQLEYNGTGTPTQNVNNYQLNVTAGQYGIVTSKQYHPYLNGKSQFIQMTWMGMGAAAGVQKSFGYISSDATGTFNTGLDGIRIYKDENDDYFFQIWRNGSLIVNQARSAWYDKLDGTGPSGMNINWDNFNVCAFDFLYLGGCTVRFFMNYNGKNHLFINYFYANTDTEPIFRSPSKPIRWEIRSTTGADSMNVVCASVASEGSPDKLGSAITIANTANGITAATVGTIYALCGVRKKTGFRNVCSWVAEYAAIAGTSNDIVEVALYLNPTVAGTFTYADIANTPLQSAIGVATNTLTGGIKIHNSYAAQFKQTFISVDNILQRLNSTLNNTMDTIVLGVTPALSSTNVDVTGSMQVKWLN